MPANHFIKTVIRWQYWSFCVNLASLVYKSPHRKMLFGQQYFEIETSTSLLLNKDWTHELQVKFAYAQVLTGGANLLIENNVEAAYDRAKLVDIHRECSTSSSSIFTSSHWTIPIHKLPVTPLASAMHIFFYPYTYLTDTWIHVYYQESQFPHALLTFYNINPIHDRKRISKHSLLSLCMSLLVGLDNYWKKFDPADSNTTHS